MRLARADARPRIHIGPCTEATERGTCHWSIGPNGLQIMADDPGAALNAALQRLDVQGDVVVIVAPLP